MPFTLLKPSGIDLAQNFAFTGTVSGAGGGKIIQRVITQNQDIADGDITTSSSSFESSGIEVTITPTSASNMIDVYFNCSMTTSNSSNEGNVMCYVNDSNATWQGGSSPSGNFWQVAYKWDSGNKYAPVTWSGRYDPSDTSALKFTIYFRRESGSGMGCRFHSSSSYFLSATEVAV